MNPDEIDAAVKSLKAQGAPDDAIHAFLQSHLGPPVSIPQGHDYHAEFASGKLAKRMEGANARDVANAQEEDAAQPSTVDQKLTNALSVGQGIPGVEAVEAAGGALGSHLPLIGTDKPLSYGESLNTLRGNTDQIGHKTRIVQKILGSAATIPFLPAGAAKAGAVIGAADQVLDADPNHGIVRRALGGAAGAAGGALLGGAVEHAGSLARSLLATPTAKNLMTRAADRAAESGPLFKAALRDGVGRTGTPQIQQNLSQPDIAEIVKGLQETRKFQGVAPDDPTMLDAVYKVLSDQQQQIKRGLDAVSPTKANIGRFRQEDVGTAKADLLDAMSGGTAPGPMPSYRPAVTKYAEHSRGIEGVQRGADAVKNTLSGSQPVGKNIVRKSDEEFARWAETATDAEKQAAAEGVLGSVKDGPKVTLGRAFIPRTTDAVRAAPNLLRSVKDAGQEKADLIAKLLLNTGNAQLTQ